ncbi:MAG: GldM family protein [Ferruginibacter sp.]
MKTIFIVLFLLLCFQTTKAQLIVMNDKMNIVYYGVDNPISVSVNGYNSKHLILKASYGELRKTEDGYRWKTCNEKQSSVSFSCFLKKGNKMIPLGQSDYRIKKVPDPVIVLGPSPHLPRINNLHNLLNVSVELVNFDFDVRFLVTQCDIEIYKKQGDTMRFHNTGPRIIDEAKKEIMKLLEGENICIKNVFVTIENCELKERELKDSALATYYER